MAGSQSFRTYYRISVRAAGNVWSEQKNIMDVIYSPLGNESVTSVNWPYP